MYTGDMQLAYLLFNAIILGSVGVAQLFSDRSLPQLYPTLYAIGTVSGFFLIWDMLVAGWFWYFVDAFVLGPHILGLPIEEWLFFISVPFGLIYLWEQLRRYQFSEGRWEWPQRFLAVWLIPSLQILAMITAVYATWQQWWYTLTVSVVFVVSVLLAQWVDTQLAADESERDTFIGGCRFWNFLAMTIVLTLIFNGYLTWEPVVVYNDVVNSSLRIGTIPLEDILYGVSMGIGLISMYEYTATERAEE